MVAHGFRDVAGAHRRSFRCTDCGKGFTPGVAPRRVDPAVRAAVRRVRRETEVPYRLLSRALGRHLGISASHATVGAWCRADDETPEPEGTPCEYLSILWALRQELTEGARDDG